VGQRNHRGTCGRHLEIQLNNGNADNTQVVTNINAATLKHIIVIVEHQMTLQCIRTVITAHRLFRTFEPKIKYIKIHVFLLKEIK